MPEASFPFAGHDHNRCLHDVLQRAEELCSTAGVRLTKLRRAVLNTVAQSHCACGAYDIIERMGRDQTAPAPISVYRALDFLVAHGLVHKIESRNAFIACCHGSHDGDAVLMICDDCGVVAELDAGDEVNRLANKAKASGFRPSQAVTELTGTCSVCAGDA